MQVYNIDSLDTRHRRTRTADYNHTTITRRLVTRQLLYTETELKPRPSYPRAPELESGDPERLTCNFFIAAS